MEMNNNIEKLHLNSLQSNKDARKQLCSNDFGTSRLEEEISEKSAEITKDIAIKFTKWQYNGDCEWILNDEDEWYVPYNPHVRINTEQLFNIFIETL